MTDVFLGLLVLIQALRLLMHWQASRVPPLLETTMTQLMNTQIENAGRQAEKDQLWLENEKKLRDKLEAEKAKPETKKGETN